MKPATALFLALALSGCSLLTWSPPDSRSGFAGWPVLGEVAPRYGHSATLLADGRLAVMGGLPDPGRVDIFDPRADTWTSVARMPEAYHGHEAARLQDGRVFVYGGLYNGMARSHAAVYDPVADTWVGGVIQEYVEGRAYHTVNLLPDGRALIAGGDHMGWSSLHTTDRAKVYDPSFSAPYVSYEVYLQQPILYQCIARTNHAWGPLPDGSVALIGGSFAGNQLDEAERFDPVTNTFAPLEPMNYERTGHTATPLPDGRLLVAGGIGRRAIDAPMLGNCEEREPDQGGIVITVEVPPLPVPTTPEKIPAAPRHLETVEIYDPQTGVWTPTASMHYPRIHHRATQLADGRVLVTGGLDERGALPHAELYDPASQTWRLLPALGHNRADHTATQLADGRVVIIGGRDGEVVVGTVEVLDASSL